MAKGLAVTVIVTSETYRAAPMHSTLPKYWVSAGGGGADNHQEQEGRRRIDAHHNVEVLLVSTCGVSVVSVLCCVSVGGVSVEW